MKNEPFHKLINAVADALERFRGAAGERVRQAADLILQSEGKVVVTGVGKSGIIGHKTAATLASTVASISGSGSPTPPQATSSNINTAGGRNDIVSLRLISIPPGCT